MIAALRALGGIIATLVQILLNSHLELTTEPAVKIQSHKLVILTFVYKTKKGSPSYSNLIIMTKLNRFNGWVAVLAFSCVALGTLIQDPGKKEE